MAALDMRATYKHGIKYQLLYFTSFYFSTVYTRTIIIRPLKFHLQFHLITWIIFLRINRKLKWRASMFRNTIRSLRYRELWNSNAWKLYTTSSFVVQKFLQLARETCMMYSVACTFCNLLISRLKKKLTRTEVSAASTAIYKRMRSTHSHPANFFPSKK